MRKICPLSIISLIAMSVLCLAVIHLRKDRLCGSNAADDAIASGRTGARSNEFTNRCQSGLVFALLLT